MHPTIDEVQEIYELWKEAFAFDDNGFTDDFFKRNFTIETCYVHRIEGAIVATLCAFPHQMILQDEQLSTMFICGVITKKPYRHKGYMNLLFQQVFQIHEHCPLFLLQAYQPRIYTSLDFHMQYKHYVYEVNEATPYPYTISQIQHAKDMVQLSDIFLSNYDGYFMRDVAYYENYIQEAIAQDVLLYGIYEQDTLQGFALFDKHNACIEEVMYTNKDIRNALFSYALSICDTLKVHSVEVLCAPLLTQEGNLMIRLHNKNQLKKIYQRDIETLEDLYDICTKPLYHYGSW